MNAGVLHLQEDDPIGLRRWSPLRGYPSTKEGRPWGAPFMIIQSL